MYTDELKELGLTENQSKIYMHLLTKKEQTSSEIAKSLGLHRGYISDTLERMQEKDVVSSFTQDTKKYYRAVNPDDLLNLMRLKLENFESITPKLMELAQNMQSFKIDVYKGKKAFRTLLSDIMSNVISSDDEILFLGIDEKMIIREVEPFYFKKFIKDMEKTEVSARAIVKSGVARIKFPNIVHKVIDEKNIGNVLQIMYKDKTAFFINDVSNIVIIIENNEFTLGFKKQFEFL